LLCGASARASKWKWCISLVGCVHCQDNRHYRTLTKTRKYVNSDGQVVTSQTSTIVVSGEENKRQQEHELWYVVVSFEQWISHSQR